MSYRYRGFVVEQWRDGCWRVFGWTPLSTFATALDAQTEIDSQLDEA